MAAEEPRMLLDETFCSDHLRATELRLLRTARDFEGSATRLEDELRRIEAEIEDRLADPFFDHPAAWLRTRLGLSATEERAIWLLIGCELSPRIRVLVRELATEQVLEPTVDVVRRVVYGGATAIACREIHPSARLFDLRLAEVVDNAPGSRTTLRATDRAIALGHGDRGVDPEIAEFLVDASCSDAADLVVDDEVVRGVAAALSGARDVVTMLVGGRGVGRRSVVQACAAQLGRETLVIDLKRATAEGAPRLLRALAREARLLDRAVVLRDPDATSHGVDVLASIDRLLVGHVPVFVTTTTTLRLRWRRPVVTIEMPPLKETQRARVWAHAIPEATVESARDLATRHAIAPGLVHAAVRIARTHATRLDASTIGMGLRLAIDDGLAQYATRIKTTQTWQDLVLPDDQFHMITELVARASHREHVYDRWGFGAKVGKGLGISALFSGPPGTGKTMIAGLIAKELGLECYQVDLSRMASKWLGETEKNLAALFDAAEAAQVVLLFDEADSLFGKRTAVTSANDRYANLEVNYMLQRMESFTGIAILTTNHEQAIDEAFRRRLSIHVRVPVPDVEERALIWKAMVPETAMMETPVDFRDVAARFAMSGGYIKNAMLRAAFLAAAEATSIGMRHIEYAAHVEYEGMGKLAPREALR